MPSFPPLHYRTNTVTEPGLKSPGKFVSTVIYECDYRKCSWYSLVITCNLHNTNISIIITKTPPTVHIKPLIGNVAFLTQKRRYCNAVSFCALFTLITAFFRFVTNFVSHFKGGWARPLVRIMFIEILSFFLNIIVPFLYFFSKSDQKTTRGRAVSSFPISADR